jgi:hypothetical protein
LLVSLLSPPLISLLTETTSTTCVVIRLTQMTILWYEKLIAHHWPCLFHRLPPLTSILLPPTLKWWCLLILMITINFRCKVSSHKFLKGKYHSTHDFVRSTSSLYTEMIVDSTSYNHKVLRCILH